MGQGRGWVGVGVRVRVRVRVSPFDSDQEPDSDPRKAYEDLDRIARSKCWYVTHSHSLERKHSNGPC